VKIIVDENMPLGPQAFSALGEVTVLPGRAIDAQAVRDADALAIRSVTKVTPALLQGSRVRFVGTATIGTDHVDAPGIQKMGVTFASAPGSNANSVSEYITAMLLTLAHRRGEKLQGRTLGVIGCGNVGSRVAAKAEALGMTVLRNDPPLQRQTGSPAYLPLEKLFAADFITVHVPLTREGPDATWRLVDAAFLSRMKPTATLINSSRGEVVHGEALAQALDRRVIRAAALDVWENEPGIDFDLVHRVALATPHIAGYSYDGKLNGTDMIYRAACACFGVQPTFDVLAAAPATSLPLLRLHADGREDEDVLREAVKALYDIEADDARLRSGGAKPPEQRGPHFDHLRKTYPIRREFHNTIVLCDDASPRLRAKLKGLGFRVQ